jgi:DNA-binding NarL/FixJ family response regulator
LERSEIANHPETLHSDSRMRVAIIEDYSLEADLLAMVCRRELGFEVVLVEGRGRPGLRGILELRPQLVLLDVMLPDVDGLAVAETLLRELPATRVIIVSAMNDPVTLHSVRTIGVHGFVDKRLQTIAMLKNAIDLVARGHFFFAPVVSKAAAAERTDPKSFTRILSDYEQHILSLIGASKSDAEIAAALGISPVTAQSRRRDIMNKLNIHSTPKLIRYALEQGFTRAGYFPRQTKYLN